jgi:transposase-like protein
LGRPLRTTHRKSLSEKRTQVDNRWQLDETYIKIKVSTKVASILRVSGSTMLTKKDGWRFANAST